MTFIEGLILIIAIYIAYITPVGSLYKSINNVLVAEIALTTGLAIFLEESGIFAVDIGYSVMACVYFTFAFIFRWYSAKILSNISFVAFAFNMICSFQESLKIEWVENDTAFFAVMTSIVVAQLVSALENAAYGYSNMAYINRSRNRFGLRGLGR